MRRPWLAPLSPLYRGGLAWHELRLRRGWEPVQKLKWPVISVGNLSTGGSGKTPLTIALAKLLAARRLHVDVLSRGYGRASSLPMKVNPEGLAQQFGDEPLLIAREAGVPVYVAAQRYDAGLLAETAAGNEFAGLQGGTSERCPSAHILDDGFQHRQLARAVDILLLNREDWRDTLLPAGNLREGLPAARRAHVLVVPADDPDFESELRRWGWNGPMWRVRRLIQTPKVDGPVFAFCGIARPEQFFAGLEDAGLHLAGRKAFRDHSQYTGQIAARLMEQARSAGARAFVTTEKDAVRLGPLGTAFPADLPLTVAKLNVEIEDADTAIDWLLARLAAGESSHPV